MRSGAFDSAVTKIKKHTFHLGFRSIESKKIGNCNLRSRLNSFGPVIAISIAPNGADKTTLSTLIARIVFAYFSSSRGGSPDVCLFLTKSKAAGPNAAYRQRICYITIY